MSVNLERTVDLGIVSYHSMVIHKVEKSTGPKCYTKENENKVEIC